MLVIPPTPASTEPSKPPIVTVAIAALVAMAIAVSLWVVLKRPQENPTGVVQVNVPARMNQAERAYAKALHIENVALSRAENFIHQQVTILNADQRRSFEISFDRVPASWNMQQPAVTVAGLQLASEK